MSIRHGMVAMAISLALLQTAVAGESNAGRSYKWVDSNGVTHYGDTIPPEYASQGRAELNSQGVAVRQFPRQLTPAEAAEAQRQAAEAARQRQHDSSLLTTYMRVSDIEQLRDERVALIDGQLEIARGSLGSAEQRLTALQQRLTTFKPYSGSATARRVPDQLAEEVVQTLNERRSMQSAIESREKQKAALLAEFAADIARFRELTARPANR